MIPWEVLRLMAWQNGVRPPLETNSTYGKLRRKLRTFRSMDSAERGFVLQSLALPWLLQLSFRMIGVPRTQAYLRRWALSSRRGKTSLSPEEAIRFARRTHSISRRLVGFEGTCLARSMTLWALLLRRNVSTDLRVGFRKRNDRIEGHAWLEFQGSPVNETAAEVSSYQVSPDSSSFDRWASLA